MLGFARFGFKGVDLSLFMSLFTSRRDKFEGARARARLV